MTPALMSPDTVTLAHLQALVTLEARCLDEGRWADWDALFASDGWYWLPADTAHTDPLGQASHLYDDAVLRRVRLARLQNPQAHSQQPPGRCHHLLQACEPIAFDAAVNRFSLRTPFLYTELRGGRSTQLPGVAWHTMRVQDGALRIVLKRVDLLHAAEALPAVEFYI